MEFLVLVAGALLLAPIVIAIVALAHTSGTRAKMERLERELRELRAELRAKQPSVEERGGRAQTVEPVPAAAATPIPRPPSPPPREALPPPLQPRAATVPAPSKPRIEWERWLGVKGAAVLGGVFLAVAGILFFQYSIERGLITREMRIVLGTIAGLGCLAGGEVVRRRGYALTGNAITGAGVVILYAAFWSAYHLGIFAFGVSFGLMVLVTAVCGFLSWRNESQVVAWLGLSGGFATPILLSTGRDEPIALFGYLLLLDVSFLFVANKRRWPLIGALGLFGTALIQLLWIGDRMGPETFSIALIVLGAFALLFAFFAPGGSERGGMVRLVTQAFALLLPFAFAVYFSQRADVGYHLYPLILLSALLATAAGWMARKQDASIVPVGAAVGGVGMALAWVFSSSLDLALAWELAVCALLFCAPFHFFCEWRRGAAGPARGGHDAALLVALLGMEAALAVSMTRAAGVPVWPYLAGFVVLPLAFLRLGALARRAELSFFACLPATAAIGIWMVSRSRSPEHPEGFPLLLACLAVPVVLLGASWIRREEPGRRWSFVAVSIACLPLFPALASGSRAASSAASFTLISVLALGVCMALAASSARTGVLVGLAALATAIAQASSVGFHPDEPSACLVILVASSALFAAWPLFRPSAWSGSRSIWWVAPVSALVWYGAAEELWVSRFGSGALGLLPGISALILIALAARARSLGAARAMPYLTVAAFFLGLAAPVQLDREALPFALAFTALAAGILWRRTDHLPLKYVAAGAAPVVLLGLLGSSVIESLSVEATPVVNGHAFDLLLPGIALLAASLLVLPLERPHIRPSETSLYRSGIPLVASLCGLCGLFVVFLWINVEVENAFSSGDRFRLEFGDHAARDLSLSIAWAIYALLLLFAGMSRKSGLLRWVSLVLLLATIAKVFLLDLDDLRGLYRVGSFLGLALSLLAVSWLYQRFVFRKAPEPVV